MGPHHLATSGSFCGAAEACAGAAGGGAVWPLPEDSSLHHLIEAKASRLLTRRELLECRKEFADDVLRRNEQKCAIETPLGVPDADLVRLLEWIGTQVAKTRESHRHERFLPDVQPLGSLLLEGKLPIVIANGDHRSVIVEIEEFVTRILPFRRASR